jgi:hypothetical protein
MNLSFRRYASSKFFLIPNQPMTLIKKSEQLLLLKIKKLEDEEQNVKPENDNFSQANPEPRPLIIETQLSNYIPARDNPIVQSIGNSGWQVSDIWRDIRVDNFSDF